MNRLLSKLRQADRTANGIAGRHLRVVGPNRPARRRAYVLTAAETAPCTCPDFCERDHGNE